MKINLKQLILEYHYDIDDINTDVDGILHGTPIEVCNTILGVVTSDDISELDIRFLDAFGKNPEKAIELIMQNPDSEDFGDLITALERNGNMRVIVNDADAWEIIQNADEYEDYGDEYSDKHKDITLMTSEASANGYTYGPAYHGTKVRFTIFDVNKVGRTRMPDTQQGSAFFFTTSKSDASMISRQDSPDVGISIDGDFHIIHAMFKMDNPLKYYDEDAYESININTLAVLIADAKANGQDGVIYTMDKSEVFVLFKSSQIKIVDANTHDDDGNKIPIDDRFDDTNDDMRY